MTKDNPRVRCRWTTQEEKQLIAAVSKEPSDAINWFRVAAAMPKNRSNKDVRKHWLTVQSRSTSRYGSWEADEDKRLCEAIATHGPAWTVVAKTVGTRNSEQCSKRWLDVLDPSICRAPWTSEEDELLIQLVKTHGRSWSQIASTHLSPRTGLSVKNRYAHLIRVKAQTALNDSSKSHGEEASKSKGKDPPPEESVEVTSSTANCKLEPPFSESTMEHPSISSEGEMSSSMYWNLPMLSWLSSSLDSTSTELQDREQSSWIEPITQHADESFEAFCQPLVSYSPYLSPHSAQTPSSPLTLHKLVGSSSVPSTTPSLTNVPHSAATQSPASPIQTAASSSLSTSPLLGPTKYEHEVGDGQPPRSPTTTATLQGKELILSPLAPGRAWCLKVNASGQTELSVSELQ